MRDLSYALFVARHSPVNMTVNDMKVYIQERRSSYAKVISRQVGNGAAADALLAQTRSVVISDPRLDVYVLSRCWMKRFLKGNDSGKSSKCSKMSTSPRKIWGSTLPLDILSMLAATTCFLPLCWHNIQLWRK